MGWSPAGLSLRRSCTDLLAELSRLPIKKVDHMYKALAWDSFLPFSAVCWGLFSAGRFGIYSGDAIGRCSRALSLDLGFGVCGFGICGFGFLEPWMLNSFEGSASSPPTSL